MIKVFLGGSKPGDNSDRACAPTRREADDLWSALASADAVMRNGLAGLFVTGGDHSLCQLDVFGPTDLLARGVTPRLKFLWGRSG